jgi:tetratricopeptide (TPR) repeat protein
MPDTPRIEELRRRVESDPASFAFAVLAEEYRKAGRIDDAIATCRAGLDRHPSYHSARATLGRALAERGDFEAAREAFEAVLRAAPDHLAAQRGLAEVNRRGGDARRARQVAALERLLASVERRRAAGPVAAGD